jgi:kynurenine formamidase
MLQKKGVELRQGDAPLINTGWMRLWGVNDKKFLTSCPGIEQDVARYLVEKGVVGVGIDQWHSDTKFARRMRRPRHVFQTLSA